MTSCLGKAKLKPSINEEAALVALAPSNDVAADTAADAAAAEGTTPEERTG